MHGRTDNNGNAYNCRSCLDRVTLHSMSNRDFVSDWKMVTFQNTGTEELDCGGRILKGTDFKVM